jgi:hypothetical protein
LVAGSVVLLLTALAIHKDHLGIRETAVFRLVNDLALPGWTWPGVWLVMQLGVIGAVPWSPPSRWPHGTCALRLTRCSPPAAST